MLKVTIKKFNVDMEIKNAGIELDICDNNETHIGDLVINKKDLIGCRGKTTLVNGKRINWQDFINYIETSR